MKHYLITLLLSLLSITCFAQTGSAITYKNPVIAGDFADPSVIRVGDIFYAAGTSSEWAPAYPIYTSNDLINWQYVGPVFNQLPSWTMGSFWAPELYHRNGTFYVYYTARRKSDQRSYIGVATTRDLKKGFTDHGCLLEWTNEAIDAFVLEDAGKLFITWKAYGLDKGKATQILGRELTPDGLKVNGEVFTLLQADPNNWEAGGAEGQAIFKRGRYFYMTYSGNACCGPDCNYQVGLARAEKLQGPWEKYAGNPVLKSGENWKCPGHGTVVTTPDNRYFYLHHAYKSSGFTFTGREGVLGELIWDSKTDWPTFRYGDTTPAQAAAPFTIAQKQNLNVSAKFEKGEKPLSWVWDVSQPAPEFSLQNGYLQLPTSMVSLPAGNFLGLVVKNGTYAFTAEFQPQNKVLQSVCIYGDSKNALGFGINQDSLELWQVKDGRREVLQKLSVPGKNSPITLTLSSRQGKSYQFSWKNKNGKSGSMGKEPLDGAFLPRWDRAPRVGISVKGENQAAGKIGYVLLQYE
ncbi:glycoside hydrolase family 43 protein [Adhaeribacter radiodurans]|uniref:Family 43 glycosylhydrolase n=1 Tax=Adhaeribacter radiodurans TaxID=2745197 RepID=A0A7L7L7A4_9BACT|nr:glycoside hydrolase family 43 protein [Adhaeribacter radiodurans]QMU28688.1 family 43 glycosylhydrolase [Adhaeribacter radiodurans]